MSGLLDKLAYSCQGEEGAEVFVKAIEDKAGSIRKSDENGREDFVKWPIVPETPKTKRKKKRH